METFGTYSVYELLGSGGMATVHRAESTSAGGFRKRVALKRLLPHLKEEPEVVESFAREAKLASHLRHVNIAQTYDLGIVDGTTFIAMELVPGPTLKQILRQCDEAAGAIPIEHVIEIMTQVCDALDYAHNLVDEHGRSFGMVHRDVSPANVIVSNSGTVKLIDFGLAKVKASRNTRAGLLKGKLSYMAPEYTLGQLDHRADLFAVGVILHEMLTGRPLFDNPNEFEIITMLREMPIQPPSRWNPQVKPVLDDIVMTALSRDPGLRWQSAAALRAALANAAIETNRISSKESLARWLEWAFSQETRRDVSGLQDVISQLQDPSDQRPITIEPDRMLTPTPAPLPVAPDPTAPTTIAKLGVSRQSAAFETGVVVGYAPMPVLKQSSRAWIWIVLLLVIAAGAGGAYWYLFLRQ
ncbi:MAG: protein kinase [Kofleriaceae bacterium]